MVNRINLLMQAKNLTARQFAEEIGIQPSGMSHILSGRNNPSLDFVMKVIKRWPEINISWLMFGTEEMYAGLPPNAPQPVAQPVQKPVQQTSTQPYQNEEVEVPQDSAQSGGEYDLFSQPEPQAVEAPVPSHEQPASSFTHVDVKQPEPPQHVASQPTAKQAVPVASPIPPIEAAEVAKPKHNENRISEVPQPPMPLQPILTKKKIVKMIVLYEDHSFAEYYPE